MAKQYPRVNDGWIAGEHRKSLIIPAGATPHEKGKYRKSYWAGRVSGEIDDLKGCMKYMRVSDIEQLAGRVRALYVETLTVMYGEDGARDFLARTENE